MDQGFLVYVTRTYPAMVPYLKGFHLTIDMWRGGRNIEGWKVRDNASAGSSASLDCLDMRGRDLSLVDQVDDVNVEDAAHRVRLKTYRFEDALGKQFGATISHDYNCGARLAKATTSSTGVRFRIGLWTAAEEEESSNYKELRNLVDTVKEEAEAGRLRNCEFFYLLTILQPRAASTKEH